jgi:ATP-dependent protease ClpP protease subunit
MAIENDGWLELAQASKPFTTFQDGEQAIALVNDEITVENSRELVDFIQMAASLDEIKSIKMLINSPGGSVFGGFSIYSALKDAQNLYGKEVFCSIQGICASIAAVIYLAAPISNRSMVDFGLYMIHNASGGSEKVLDKMKESLMVILAKDIPGDLDSMMTEETWLNRSEMVKMGIIQGEKTPENIKNSAQELFKLVNINLFNTYKSEIMALNTANDNLKNASEEDEKKKEMEGPMNEDEKLPEDEPMNEDAPAEDKDAMIAELQKQIEDLKAELAEYKTGEEVIDKIALLNKAGIDAKNHQVWLDQPIDKIKSLIKTVTVNKVSPKVEFDLTAKVENKTYSNMTSEERIQLMTTDIEAFNAAVLADNKKRF